jgi:hypothetical protein
VYKKNMRIIISTAVGLGIGLVFLVSVLEWVSWCPFSVFVVLHYPSILVIGAFFPGEVGFWGSLPYLPIQWPLLGALIGVVLHFRHRSACPTPKQVSGSAEVTR